MSIGIGEILITLIVAFVVVGPEDLPKVVRTLAKLIKKIRNMMKGVTESFEKDLELEKLKEETKELKQVNTELERVQQAVIQHASDVEQITHETKP